MALLRYLSMGQMTPQAAVSMHGLEAGLEQIFRGFTLRDYEAFRPNANTKGHPLPEEVGLALRQAASDFRRQIEFLGNITANLLPTFLDWRRMRWMEVRRVFESAGANAVPIVSLVSVLVGMIIAFEAAQPLAKFGAQIFVVNMIGLVMVRELGPLLTAVLLAGRSGSAFAAEIGTMKVNEELDALQTLGLDPIRFLVVQRITAAILLTPLLTIYATFLGVVGGVSVALVLGFPLSLIFHQLTSALHLSDVALGMAKASGVWSDCLRRRLLARIADTTRPERSGRFNHASCGDEYRADCHRRRRIFDSLLCPQTMNDAPEITISVRNLKVGYGENVILQNINFQVSQGEVFVILGGSGSGKSTLLKNLIGLYTPLEGEVWIEGAQS